MAIDDNRDLLAAGIIREWFEQDTVRFQGPKSFEKSVNDLVADVKIVLSAMDDDACKAFSPKFDDVINELKAGIAQCCHMKTGWACMQLGLATASIAHMMTNQDDIFRNKGGRPAVQYDVDVILQRIDLLVREDGISQTAAVQQVAEERNVSPSTVYRWLSQNS